MGPGKDDAGDEKNVAWALALVITQETRRAPGGRCGVCLVCAVRLFAIQA
ncbi:MAG: hypothetical protein RIT02_3227 [Planctomycetota bacterium]